jgi:hypothetical protein
MTSAKLVLEAVREERERAQALAALKKQTNRSVPTAVASFCAAAFYLMIAFVDGMTVRVGESRVFTVEGLLLVLAAACFVTAGVQKLRIAPRDRLLLSLLSKIDQNDEKA